MGRWVGLDLGERRIGVAVSDPLGITAQGVEVYHRNGDRTDIRYLAKRFTELEGDKLVIGLPRNMNGSLGPMAEKVQEMGRRLGEACGVLPVYWDERLTTVQATRVLVAADLSRAKRRQVVDRLSAVLILQSFLDAGASNKVSSPEVWGD